MATERATIEVEGVRVSCDGCGVTLAEHTEPEDAVGLIGKDCWSLATRQDAGASRKQRRRDIVWLCNDCGEAIYAAVQSRREAVQRRAKAAS